MNAIAWTVLAVAGTVSLAAAQPVNPTAAALAEFQKRLDTYLRQREQAVAGVPKLKETPAPAEISAREEALREALRSARSAAAAGDLVGPVEAILRKTVRDDWSRRSPAERQALATEIPRVGKVVVNTTYPAGMPLATVPPVLLQSLPRLPEALEYRFMGRALVLRDVSANLIVDLVDRALPSR